jgi:hypothetical protein
MFIFTAGCTGLILRRGPGGCKRADFRLSDATGPALQPEILLAGIKGVEKAYLENLIMNGVFLIPISAIVMGIGIGMLGLWTDHKRKSQMLEQMHKERMAAIEKGIDLPPMNLNADPFAGKSNAVANPARILRNGVFMVTFGIVLYFALDTVGASAAAVFGLIPATIGVANLAYAAVLFDKERKAEAMKERERLPPL